jgi:hypothetical protein
VNSGSICAGGSFTMNPSGAATYTFQGGSAVVSPSSNSTYTVIGSSAYGCLSAGFATSSVNVIANPTISVNSGAICFGKSFTISPSGAATYTFQGGSAVVSPTANSTYTVIGSSGAGCVSNIVTSSVTVNSNPVITVNNGTICAGNSFTMVPSGAISYTFQGGSAVVSPGSSTSYTVIGSNGVGCVSNPVSSFITVYALPLVNATASFSTVCQGQNVNITASGAITYSWNTGATTNVINVTPTVTSSYTVLGTDANGCSKSAVSTITVNPLPVVNIVASPTAVCIGKTATLTASGASSYLWNTASSSPSIAVTPAVTTGYTVTGTSAVGCSSTRTIVLVVNPLPTINITPAIANICIGNSATLTASGGNTYTWSTAATTSSIVVTPTTTTNYIVNATDVNGCTNSDNASVVVNALPNVLAAASSTVVCTGSSVTLSSAGAITYSWSNGATTSTTNVSPSSTTTYTVYGTNSNGCTNTATVLIAVNALPTILATPVSTAMCIGKTTTITASGGSTYVWSTSSTSSSIVVTPLTTTGYTVTGTDINGCTNTGTTTVIVNPLPTISIASSNSMICTGQTVTLTVTGAASYTWNTGSNAAMIADSPTITSTYSVFALDANGCSGSAISSVTVSTFPVLSISSSNSLICVGQSATLTVNGASTYSWSSGGITNLEVVTPTVTTNYTVTGTNAGGCATTDTITQFVSPCTGIAINSIVSENLLVYPNPSNGLFMIMLPADSKIRITNILGETVFAENLTEGKYQIDLTEFASGMYLVNAEIGGKVKTIKLIKE